MKLSWLILAGGLAACAAPEPTAGNPGLPMAPDKYSLDNTLEAVGSNGSYQTITLSWQVRDPHTLEHVGGAVVHFRATRGFLSPAPRMIADTGGRTTVVWSESFPIFRFDTVFTCSVDPGFDCYPEWPAISVGPSPGP